MIIKIDPSGIRDTRWHEYVVRFAGGGIITVIAGVIAKKWGPGVGGLFLAFPAIFPASATLIEKHERPEETRQGPPRRTPRRGGGRRRCCGRDIG